MVTFYSWLFHTANVFSGILNKRSGCFASIQMLLHRLALPQSAPCAKH